MMGINQLMSCNLRSAINVLILAFGIISSRNCVLGFSWIDIKGLSINLTTDEPAVCGAPIGFSARLIGINDNSTLYTYRWESHSAGISVTRYNESTVCNITATVEKEGLHEMKVWVERDGVKLNKASVAFRITSSINGYIKVVQPGTHAKMPGIISTNTSAQVSYVIHDPHDYFANATLFYTWAIDTAALSTINSNFSYNFTTATTYHLIILVTALMYDNTHHFYSGSSSTQLTAKDPIKMSNVTGSTSIQHGDLLDIEISCEGSTPMNYCWYFTQRYVNTSTEVCEEYTEAYSCEFFIVRYFKKSGNYKLVLIVENDIDRQVNVYNINVFQRGAEPQLSPIIVPLACSSVALVIVVVGIMYYIHTRRNYTVEVADFDFQQSDNYEIQSFVERTVDACKMWCGNEQLRQKKTSVYRRIQAQIA